MVKFDLIENSTNVRSYDKSVNNLLIFDLFKGYLYMMVIKLQISKSTDTIISSNSPILFKNLSCRKLNVLTIQAVFIEMQ